MKIVSTLLFFFCFLSFSYSQDVLFFKNGDELNSKVLEISSTEVKYRKWDNVDGPIYSVNKNELFMIKYQNGVKEVFKEEAQIVNGAPLADKNKYHELNMKLYKNKLRAGIGITAAGGAALIIGSSLLGYGEYLNSFDDGTVPFVVGIGFLIAGIPMIIVGPIRLKNSFKYRRIAESGTSFSLEPMHSSHFRNPVNMNMGYGGGMTFRLKF